MHGQGLDDPLSDSSRPSVSRFLTNSDRLSKTGLETFGHVRTRSDTESGCEALSA